MWLVRATRHWNLGLLSNGHYFGPSFVQLTHRRTGSGHDGGQPVRDYQHPRASRSHAPETGEASLETDPRGAVRGRGTTFRTVRDQLRFASPPPPLDMHTSYPDPRLSLCNEVTASTLPTTPGWHRDPLLAASRGRRSTRYAN